MKKSYGVNQRAMTLQHPGDGARLKLRTGGVSICGDFTQACILVKLKELNSSYVRFNSFSLMWFVTSQQFLRSWWL